MENETLNLLRQRLETLAAARHCYDDGDDYCSADNGNFDDAFEDGVNYGQTELARELLALLNKQEGNRT